jgi:predicted RNA-binding Zn-ribbon protein involved in translation (DUF1610 family)
LAKSPRFFCENCGAEVDRNAKSCPRCGRYFASVRCPACGFTGAEDLFGGGCPVCGYSAPSGQFRPAEKWPPPPKKPPRRIAAGTLPLWVYLITIFFLICVFSVFFFTLR